MATGLLNGSDDVRSLSYSPSDNRVAVGQADGTIDLMFDGAVDQTFNETANPVTTVAHNLRDLFYTDATKNFWHLNRQILPYVFGGAGVVDAQIFSLSQDSTPTWPGAITASYQSESVPSGIFVGIFLNATDAVLAGGVVGDWYQVSDSFTYFELTDLIGGETQIFRAGNPNFPDGGLIVATATDVIIFDIINGIPTMWMVFEQGGGFVSWTDNTLNMIGNSGNNTSVAYADGILYLGINTGQGMRRISFAEDTAHLSLSTEAKVYNSTIADRNVNSGYEIDSGEGNIVNNNVNDVAAKVLTSTEAENLLLWSEGFDDSVWLYFRASVATNVATAPDGTNTADKLLDSTDNDTHLVLQNSMGVASTEPSTFSIYLKAAEITSAILSLRNTASTGNFVSVTVDLETGTIASISNTGTATGAKATIMFAGNDWYRVSLSGIPDVSGTETQCRIRIGKTAFIGTGTDGLLAWGAQLESGVNPHDYIKTEATTVAADVPPAKQLVNVDATTSYGLLDGVVGTYFSTPDVPAPPSVKNSVTGDIDIIQRVSFDVWPPIATTSVQAKAADTNSRSYFFEVLTSGNLNFTTSQDGTGGTQSIAQSDSAPPISAGTKVWLRAYRDVDNGASQNETFFYYSLSSTNNSENVSWIQLGTTKVNAGATSIFDSTSPLEVGAAFLGTVQNMDGRVYITEIWAGDSTAGGSQVSLFDANTFPSGLGTEVWTANGNAVVLDDEVIGLRTIDTGLSIPTWAVATDGGVSVGVDTGAVWDITGQAIAPQVIDFTFDDQILSQYLFFSEVGVYPIPTADTNILSFDRRYFPSSEAANDIGAPRFLNDAGTAPGGYVATSFGIAYGSEEGLTIITEDTTDYFDGSYDWITSTYQTGFMVQPDGAWACDDSIDSIGFPFDLFDDFDGPDPLDGWTAGNGALLSIENGALRVENGAANFGFATKAVTTVIGQSYNMGTAFDMQTSSANFRASTTAGATGDLTSEFMGADGDYLASFVATGTTSYISVTLTGNTIGLVAAFDNITLQQAIAENGTFDSDTGWTKGTGWTIANGVASHTGASSNIDQLVTLEANKSYIFQWTVLNYTSGTTTPVLTGGGDIVGTPEIGAGTFTQTLITTVTSGLTGVRVNAGTSAELDIDNVIVTEALPDYSIAANPLQVIGQVTKDQFGTLSGIYGVGLDDINGLEGTVNTGGQLIGWETVATGWQFRRDISQFYDATETTGALSIRGLESGSSLAFLRWNDVPMTETALNQAEQNGGRILRGVTNNLVTTFSLNDLRFSALRAQGYLGHTNDMLRVWLADNGAGYPLIQINDMWKAFLIAFGIPEPTYQYNDGRYEFYGILGYTGSLNDREVQFWRNGGVITFGGSGSFGTAFSDAFD